MPSTRLMLLGVAHKEPSGGDPYAAYLLFDSFTDNDDIALADHVPERGGPWITYGTWLIDTNQLKETSGTVRTAVVDVAQANIAIQGTRVIAAGSDCGVIARYIDASNYWVLVTNGITDQLILYKQIAGIYIQMDAVNLVFLANDVIKLIVSDSTITAYVNGIQKIQVIDVALQTATKHGFFNHAGNYTSVRWDDVTIVAA